MTKNIHIQPISLIITVAVELLGKLGITNNNNPVKQQCCKYRDVGVRLSLCYIHIEQHNMVLETYENNSMRKHPGF